MTKAELIEHVQQMHPKGMVLDMGGQFAVKKWTKQELENAHKQLHTTEDYHK